MPSITNRALLLNLGVFSADNNIRRNIGTFTHNFQCGDNLSSNQYRVLQPSESWSVAFDNEISRIVVVEVSGQVQAEITLGEVPPATGKADRDPPETFTAIINQLIVLDDNVQSADFSNPGSVPVRVTILSA